MSQNYCYRGGVSWWAFVSSSDVLHQLYPASTVSKPTVFSNHSNADVGSANEFWSDAKRYEIAASPHVLVPDPSSQNLPTAIPSC